MFGKRNFLLFLLIVFCTFIFLHNLSSDVFGGDVGDFATAAYTAGIAHPPGYPLFTILGFILLRLPLIAAPIYKIGLISVVSSVLSLIIFYKIGRLLIKNVYISLLSTLILSFSYLFWFYTEIAEVFALNNLFVLLTYYFALKFYFDKKKKSLFFLSFFMGLGLTNHQILVLIAPGILILILKHYKYLLSNKKYLVISLLLFLLGFFPYIYVLIAASFKPIINWNGDPTAINLFNLITRKIYGTFQATPFGNISSFERVVVFETYAKGVIDSLSIPIVLLVMVGILSMLKQKKFILLFSFIISFLISGPIFNTYAGFPLYSYFNVGVAERFYIMSSIILIFFLPIGILSFYKFLLSVFSKKEYAVMITAFLFFIPILLFIKNYPRTNLSKISLGNNLAKNFLRTLPKNSLLLVAGDSETFNTWYVHYVLHFRSDVEVVNFAKYGNTKYFENQMRLYDKTPSINKKYKNVYEYLNSIRPVYSLINLSLSNNSLEWVPYGLVYKMEKKDKIPDEKEYLKKIENIFSSYKIPNQRNLTPADRNATLYQVLSDYSNAYIKAGAFIFLKYNDYNNAKKYIEKAIAINPQYPEPYAELGLISLKNNKLCGEAKKYIEKAILLFPSSPQYFQTLNLAYRQCNGKQTLDESFRKTFYQKFGMYPDFFYYTATKSASKKK